MAQDGLTEILKRLQLRAGIFVHARYCGRWALDTSGVRAATFHLVQEGHCWLHLQDRDPRALRPGDLVVFPRDARHVLSSTDEPPGEEEVNRAEQADGVPPDNRMLCGYFEFESQAAWPLLDSLPEALVIERGMPASDGLISLIFHELNHASMGTDAVIDYYAHALFVQVLRVAQTEGFAGGLLSAFSDERLGRALAAIHTEPEADWNLERLAAQAGMGRTSFAAHFKKSIGQSPMRYLQLWRLQLSKDLLANTRLSVAEIALRSGYDSEAAFRKSFRKEMGVPPGTLRRTAIDRSNWQKSVLSPMFNGSRED